VIVCEVCCDPMLGPQQARGCSFVCDCMPHARRGLAGSRRSGGMLWCAPCAVGLDDDEVTLTDAPTIGFDDEPTREMAVPA